MGLKDMSLFDAGRLCIKKTGRETSRKCVVVDVIDKNFVLITGPKELTGVRRRRANIDHLEPLEIKLNIKRSANDEEVARALRKALPEEFPPEKPEVKVKVEEKPAKRRVRRKKETEPKPVVEETSK